MLCIVHTTYVPICHVHLPERLLANVIKLLELILLTTMKAPCQDVPSWRTEHATTPLILQVLHQYTPVLRCCSEPASNNHQFLRLIVR
jgi:hypothetical protein